ncbi:diphosphate--fructose-6-phosphate 1-phosphotransferase [Candidatus Marinamargulisbacteria bacterium SCGC AG-343-D04]|nr:diphosphate--fructose-6-phosphate 1-phosphotransferase [Candidatus Marinamargulisbacteria bacterium SCGC AG-343-D04]
MVTGGVFQHLHQHHPLLSQTQGYFSFENETSSISVPPSISSLFKHLDSKNFSLVKASSKKNNSITPKNIAVVFSGGPAPGGHNTIVAIADYCEGIHTLYGVKNGPGGLLKGDLTALSLSNCLPYINTGGFDLLGTDRTKIKTEEQFKQVQHIVSRFSLDGIIIIGGDDSNTNAIFLADVLKPLNCHVIGIPKTIDGDLRFPPYLPISFGFDTAVSLYASLVKNLIKDTESIHKYWHFVKLMGRHAGFITEAVDQKASPLLSFYGEIAQHHQWTLPYIINRITDLIISRSQAHKPYGVICLSEGLFEWLPDLKALIHELNHKTKLTPSRLSSQERSLFNSLPSYIQKQLLLDTDSHGNIQLSRIETERCIMDMVQASLTQRSPDTPFHAIPHFYGYEGRCSTPTHFDASLCAHLGYIAASLIDNHLTGIMATCTGFSSSDALYGLPIAPLLHIEQRHGKKIAVIKKSIITFE